MRPWLAACSMILGLCGCQRSGNQGVSPGPPPPEEGAASTAPPTSQPTSSAAAAHWIADPANREELLATRVRTGMMLGNFRSMNSIWHAIFDVPVSADSDEIAEARLRSPFPEFYQPTWREYFDAIARQTFSSWRYENPECGFVFGEPPLAPPFDLELAPEWRGELRGQYAALIPPIANVGMDVYMMGGYSDPQDELGLYRRVREHHALAWARLIRPEVAPEDMETATVDNAEALFYSTAHPRTGVLWRQWAFVSQGECFVIMSAIEPENDAVLWPQVQAMVASFEAIPQ